MRKALYADPLVDRSRSGFMQAKKQGLFCEGLKVHLSDLFTNKKPTYLFLLASELKEIAGTVGKFQLFLDYFNTLSCNLN